MKIAICNNYRENIDYLKKLILDCDICPAGVQYYEFSEGESLLNNFKKFDLIFLDIKRGENGIRTAELIRLQDSAVPIVFYTGYDAEASRVVKIRPLSYLVKGRAVDEHSNIIRNIFLELRKQIDLPHLIVAYQGKTFVFEPIDIVFISIYDKGTAIWLRNERRSDIFGDLKKNQNSSEHTIKSGVKLDTYYHQLKNYGFIYAKKSYIINLRAVIGRNQNTVLLKGGYELTVARSKKKQFDELLIEYWRMNSIGGE